MNAKRVLLSIGLAVALAVLALLLLQGRCEFRTVRDVYGGCTYRLDKWTGASWLVSGHGACPRSDAQRDAELKKLLGR
jgi:hypothetical protein